MHHAKFEEVNIENVVADLVDEKYKPSFEEIQERYNRTKEMCDRLKADILIRIQAGMLANLQEVEKAIDDAKI